MLSLALTLACSAPPRHGSDRPPTGSPSTSEPSDTPDTGATGPAVDEDGDGSLSDADCDDHDPTVFPGAPDLCGDDRVTDCDRRSDDGLVTLDGVTGFDDLQAALSAAGPGSDLLLCPGTYVGAFQAAVAVAIHALGDASTTTLKGGGGASVLELAPGSSVAGVTIRGAGTAKEGGGIRFGGGGTLTVDGCVITGGRAGVGGGIWLGAGSVATLTGTSVDGNRADDEGGGIYVGSGSTLDLGDSVVSDNEVSAGTGGGIALADSALTGGVVRGNWCPAQGVMVLGTCFGPRGGGLHVTGVSSVTGTEVSDNQAVQGGGISIEDAVVTLTDVPVHDNVATLVDGGGLIVVESTVDLVGETEVYDNEGQFSGGGGGMYACEATVAGGVFRGNATASYGGGIAGTLDLSDAVVTGNHADYGGGGVALGGGSSATDVTISGNDSDWPGGGMVASGEDSPPVAITRVTISDNQSDRGAALWASGVEVDLDESTLIRNLAGKSGGAVHLDYGAAVVATGCDLGVGGDDNVPVDVSVDGGQWSYGADASFRCDEQGCVDAI